MPGTRPGQRYAYRDREPVVRKPGPSTFPWPPASPRAGRVTSAATTSLHVTAREAAAGAETQRQPPVFKAGCPKKHYNTLVGFQWVCSVPPFP